MRVLFDEQLSEALVTHLHDLFPDSLHVRLLGMGGAGDADVWRIARERGCLLVTKDDDFHRLSVLWGAPPKVLWIRIGNCTTEEVARLLREHHADVCRFVEQGEATFMELGDMPLSRHVDAHDEPRR